MHRGVGPPRSPRLRGGHGIVAERLAQREIRGRERVAFAARPHGHVVGRPRTDARQRAQRARRSRRGPRRDRARRRRSATAAAKPCSARTRAPVSPSADRSASATAAAFGNSCVRPSGAMPAHRLADRARRARPPAPSPAPTDTCWPRIARTPSSNGSSAPGTRRPSRGAHERPQVRVTRRAAGRSTFGSASRSNKRRTPATRCTRPSIAGQVRAQVQRLLARARPTPRSRRARRRCRRCGGTPSPSRSTASTPGIARGARNASSVGPRERRAVRARGARARRRPRAGRARAAWRAARWA